MGKKFYIASGFANKDRVVNVSTIFKEHGFVHTYDWTRTEKANTTEALREIGTAEMNAVMETDFVMVILPGGKGTHVELGLALASGTKVYLYSQDPQVFLETTFYQVAGVEHCSGKLDEVVNRIIAVESEQLVK